VELRGFFISRRRNAEQVFNIKSAINLVEKCGKLIYLEKAVANEYFIYDMQVNADEIRRLFATIKCKIIISSGI
jgi:hypothetical protein